jgi:hypothetical protein
MQFEKLVPAFRKQVPFDDGLVLIVDVYVDAGP